MNARMHSESNISITSLDGEEVIVHSAEPKSKTPMLRPLMVRLELTVQNQKSKSFLGKNS